MSLVDLAMVIGAMSTLVAFGYGLTILIARDIPLMWFERAGVAYLLGTGVASVVWIALMPLFAIVSPVVLISIMAWLMAGVAVMKKGSLASPQADRTHSGWIIALSVLLVVELAALTAASSRSGLGFDGAFNFEMRARIAFENETRGQLPLAFFSEESRAWSHLRYPLLVPFAEYWIYAWLGRVDQSVVKILFPVFYMALISMTAGAVQRLNGSVAALAAVTAMGTLPAMTVIPGAVSGYAEVPLAAVIAAAVGCALIAVQTGRHRVFWLCGVLSAIAAWTKVEGGILALCLGGIALTVAGRRAWPLVVLPATVIISWNVFQNLHGLPEPDFPSLSPHIALANLNRIPIIARGVIRELLTPGHWGLLWPAFAVLCALALRQRRWRDGDLMTAAVVVIPLCVYPAVYLFSSWSDLEGHVRTSFVRLLVPLTPAAIMFTVAQLWEPRDAGVRA